MGGGPIGDDVDDKMLPHAVLPAPPAKKEYKASGVRAPALWWSVAISMPKEDVTMDST